MTPPWHGDEMMPLRKESPGNISPNMASWTAMITLTLVAILILITSRPAYAHTEGKMQLSAEPAGPYKMTVFSSPDPAVTGEIHIAALIFTAEDASPVLDAQVFVEIEPLEEPDQAIVAMAELGDAENNLLYEAILDVASPGLYQVTVVVQNGEDQGGSASFELDIASSGGFNWPLVIAAAGVVLVLVIGIVIRLRGRQPEP